MGACISNEPDIDFTGPVDFDHFHILRAIGKGAFGKVCIVKKRDTKVMFAMKYMNKVQIIRKHAVENVFREIKILQTLEHPFLVNMWFTFQDREDIFMVLDLMLGGDVSFHLEKEGRFKIPRVRLYVAELALALEYLKEKNIIHRDVKPANVLLDSEGHAHLTDFNVACIVRPGLCITSVTGTKPYMAPEVIRPGSEGYSFAVDWWSLGVSAYEMLRGQRPFYIDRNMSNDEIYNLMRHTRPTASVKWDSHTCDMLKMLLHPDDDKRIHNAEQLQKLQFFADLSMEQIREKGITPSFIPPHNRINCDPTHELEEMIVEPNPLHKKHHRLSKRNHKSEDDMIEQQLQIIDRRFRIYNRDIQKDPGTNTTLTESNEASPLPTIAEIEDNSHHVSDSVTDAKADNNCLQDSSLVTVVREDVNNSQHTDIITCASDDNHDHHSTSIEVELALTNIPPPRTERTLSGDTIISITCDSAGLIPA